MKRSFTAILSLVTLLICVVAQLQCQPDETAYVSAKTNGKTLFIAGDTIIARRMHHRENAPLKDLFGQALPYMRSADATFVNMEGTLSDRGIFARAGEKGVRYSFRSRPAMVRLLAEAGVDIVSLSNNHAGDYGKEGLFDTLDILNARGIIPMGAGRNIEEAADIKYVMTGNLVTAWISFHWLKFQYGATEQTPGNHAISPNKTVARLTPLIKEAKKHAHVVLVTPHWGQQDATEPEARTKKVAHGIIDAGADAIFGHSSHRLQGMEIYRDKPILYDVGNFLTDFGKRDRGMFFLLDFDERGIFRVSGIPVWVNQKHIGTMTKEQGQEVMETFLAHSKSIHSPINATLAPDRVIVNVRADKSPRTISGQAKPTEAKAVFDFSRKPGCVLTGLPPGVQQTGSSAFENGIEFLGSRFPTQTKQDHTFSAHLYFRANVKIPASRTRFFITLVDPRTGRDVVSEAHEPADWAYPIDRWQPGEIIEDGFMFYPDSAPPGRYDIYLQMGTHLDKNRVKVTDGQTRSDPYRLPVGSIDII